MGQQFAQYYYQTFAANRSGLANLYQADSLLTYEGTEFMGQQAIMEKILVRPAHQRLNETCVCVYRNWECVGCLPSFFFSLRIADIPERFLYEPRHEC